MKAYVNPEHVRQGIIQEITGVTLETLERYTQVIKTMREAVRESLADPMSNLITNLSPQEMMTLGRATLTTAQQGHMAERYYTNRLKLTKDNQVGAGDFTDQYGRRGEMKFANPSYSKGGTYWVIHGIRTQDKVDYYTIILHHPKTTDIEVFQVPHDKMASLSRYDKLHKSARLFVSPNGVKRQNLEKFKLPITASSIEYFGARYDADRIFRENNTALTELQAINEVRDKVYNYFQGFNRPNHVTLSELLSLKPFMSQPHFGLIFQSWAADNMKVAQSANHRKAGDAVLAGGKRLEIKTCTPVHHKLRPNQRNAYWANINPGAFDEILLIVTHEDHIEYFHMTHRQFMRHFKEQALRAVSKDEYMTLIATYSASAPRKGSVLEILRRPEHANKDLNLSI